MPWSATASVNVAQSVSGSVSDPMITTPISEEFNVRLICGSQFPLLGDLTVTDAASDRLGSSDGFSGVKLGAGFRLMFDAISSPLFTCVALTVPKLPLMVSVVG